MNSKELAHRLNVSPATVSRVLSGKGADYRIGKLTCHRVLKAAQALGVAIDHQARGLRLGATHTLGFIAPDISNPFFSEFCRQSEQIARLRGYTVLIADSQEDEAVERDSIRLMQSRKVDGLILAPVIGRGRHLDQLARETKALVLFDRVGRAVQAPGVVLDNFGAARAGVRLLAQAGHRRIACLQGVRLSVANRQRVLGYRAEMKNLNLPVVESWIAGGDSTVEMGRAGTAAILRSKVKPTAILALSNFLALGVLETLRSTGLSVPQDMSLLSFDEQPWAASLSPPLTTIAQPVAAMATKAMELLFNALAKPQPARALRMVSPFHIIERRSVAART